MNTRTNIDITTQHQVRVGPWWLDVTHVKRAAVMVAATAALTGGAWLGTTVAHADPFDQRDFPCQEDEVLGYAPQFGPDRVGCIHIDTETEH